jgi:HEAT repeat protein
VSSTLAIATCAALGATSDTALRNRAPAPATAVVATELFVAAEEQPAPPSRAVRALHHALTTGDQDEREKAAMTLALMSGAEVIPALLIALTDRDAQVRENAAMGLALRRDERIVAPLLRAMTDFDPQVREKAAIALGASGDARAAAALQAALEDADGQVREKVRAGLLLLSSTQK